MSYYSSGYRGSRSNPGRLTPGSTRRPSAASDPERYPDTVAEALRLKVQVLEVRNPDDFEVAFGAIARERTGTIILPIEPLILSQRKRVAEFAAQHRLPLLVHGPPSLLEPGGLLSYGMKEGELPGSWLPTWTAS